MNSMLLIQVRRSSEKKNCVLYELFVKTKYKSISYVNFSKQAWYNF